VLVQKLGDNVVDFVFKTFVSIITSLGYVGNIVQSNRFLNNKRPQEREIGPGVTYAVLSMLIFTAWQ
jgi:hypothetical protein